MGGQNSKEDFGGLDGEKKKKKRGGIMNCQCGKGRDDNDEVEADGRGGTALGLLKRSGPRSRREKCKAFLGHLICWLKRRYHRTGDTASGGTRSRTRPKRSTEARQGPLRTHTPPLHPVAPIFTYRTIRARVLVFLWVIAYAVHARAGAPLASLVARTG